MRPLFTIHGGEYIQKRLKLNTWIPTNDTSIDLLVTDRDNCRTVSLQIMYGKDLLPEKSAKVQKNLRCVAGLH
jgi:hypothetical protein